MRASHLIRTRFEVPFFLWGLRLGSLLAAELLITQSDTTAGVLMWAPLAHGRTWIDSIMIPDLPGQAMKQPIGCKQAHIPKLEAQTLTGLNSEILDEGETESNVRTLITRGGEYRSSFLEEIRLLSLNPIRNHHPESANAEVAQLTISKNNDNDHLASHSNNEPPELDMISKAWEAAGFRVYAKAVHGDSFWLHPGANEPLALYEASEAWLSRSMAQVK